jgi:hypothetical protein
MVRTAGYMVLFLWTFWCSARAEEGCSPYIEAQPSWQSAAFRRHTDDFRDCPVSEATYRRVLGDWLQRPSTASAAPLHSIGLGRAVHFPWISEYLATAALSNPDWDTKRGRSRSGDPNAVVASILSDPAFIQRLQVPFGNTTYEVVAVSVEKVLVGEVRDILPGRAAGHLRVPYDAMLWMRLSGGD